MSLIHQALKKVQTIRETNALPVYSGGYSTAKHKGHIQANPSMARVLWVLTFLLFIIAAVAGWWAVNRIDYRKERPGLNTSGQAVLMDYRTSADPSGQANYADAKGGGAIIAAHIPSTDRRDGTGVGNGHLLPGYGGEMTFGEARNKNLRGVELYREGKFFLAKEEFLFSIQIFLEYAEAYNNIGLTYKQLGDVKKAEDSYKKAIKYKPNYPEAMNNYGVLLDGMGNPGLAQEYFKKAIMLVPDYPDPCLNMAISLEKERRFDEAVDYYERFLSHARQREGPLLKDIRERVLYLNTSGLTVQKSQ